MKGKDNFAETLGIQLLEAKDGCSKVQMKVEKKHTNAYGFTHGGAVFSVADYAFAHACNFGDNVALAVQVDINFLRPSVEGDTLTAEAVRVNDGKTMGLYHIAVKNQEKLVAFFSGLAFKNSFNFCL